MAIAERVKYFIVQATPYSGGWKAQVMLADAESIRWNDVPLAWIRSVLLPESAQKPLNEMTKEDIDYSKIVLNANTCEYFEVKRNYDVRLKTVPTQQQIDNWIGNRVSDYVNEINNPPEEPELPQITWMRDHGISHVRANGQDMTIDAFAGSLE